MKIAFLTLAILLLLAPNARAYNSVIQTGEVIDPGAFQAAIVPQAILGQYKGIGVDALLDVGVDNGSSARGLIGVGDAVGFEVGGFYKYVPFPDTDKQPAIGGEIGVVFARTSGLSEVDLRFNPLVSKKFETEVGDFTPYLSVPIGLAFRDGLTSVPVQLAVGSELRLLSTQNLSFFLEGGVNLNAAFGYISGALAWRFDEVSLKRHKAN